MSSTSVVASRRAEISGTDVVHLDVPASPVYIAVVRTAAAGLAARVDLTLDRIEDLRIAVGEACALLMPQQAPSAPGDTLSCVFMLVEASLTVAVSGPSSMLPERSSFAWAMLSALVDEVETGEDDGDQGGRTWLRLVVRREVGP